MTNFSKADEATQSARFNAMLGMTLLYIPPMTAMFPGKVHPSTKALVMWIKEKGTKVIHCGKKDAQCEAWWEEGMCDGEVIADLSDDANAASNIVKGVAESGLKIDAVFSRTEQWQPLVGQVCELLNIPCNPVSAYAIARNKHESRVAIAKAGLRTPKSATMSTLDDIENALKEVPFPLVVKPTAGAGSMGVFRANNEEDLRMYVAKVFEEIAGSQILAQNPGVTNVAPCMIEEFLQPKKFGDLPVGEFDVDVLMWNGEAVYARVCDNWLPSPPYFLENGSNFPSVVSSSVQAELEKYSVDCVKAMGFNRGAFHVECIYTEDGAQLIEVNPRVGGGPDEHFHLSVTGVHMTQNFLLCMMNIPINPPRAEKDLKCIVHYDVCCPKTGTLNNLDFFREALQNKYLVGHEFYVKAGISVIGFDTKIPQWLGALFMEGTPEEAAEVVKAMEREGDRVLELVDVTPDDPMSDGRGSRKASVLIDGDLPSFEPDVQRKTSVSN
eukprot:CFRG2163T1